MIDSHAHLLHLLIANLIVSLIVICWLKQFFSVVIFLTVNHRALDSSATLDDESSFLKHLFLSFYFSCLLSDYLKLLSSDIYNYIDVDYDLN